MRDSRSLRAVGEVPARMRAVLFDTARREVALREMDTPAAGPEEALVRTLVTGVDGTDEEVVRGQHGQAPPGRREIVLGHECLGEIVAAPPGSPLAAGDLVVPLVRHGCGGCAACREDAVDLCPTQDYREHGIRGLDGFMRDYWTDDPRTLVPVPRELGLLGALVEPLSIAVKALETARHVQRRIPWFEDEGGFRGKRALVAGTGSLGSLAAFLLRHEGMHVWAMDRSGDETAPARLLRDVGARHVDAREQDPLALGESVGGFDLIVEATGSPEVVFDVARALGGNGVMAILGVPARKGPVPIEADDVMRGMVLRNQALFGSVNSARTHVEEAASRLLGFRERWGARVGGLVTHVFGPERAPEALAYDGDDLVKKVVQWSPIP